MGSNQGRERSGVSRRRSMAKYQRSGVSASTRARVADAGGEGFGVEEAEGCAGVGREGGAEGGFDDLVSLVPGEGDLCDACRGDGSQSGGGGAGGANDESDRRAGGGEPRVAPLVFRVEGGGRRGADPAGAGFAVGRCTGGGVGGGIGSDRRADRSGAPPPVRSARLALEIEALKAPLGGSAPRRRRWLKRCRWRLGPRSAGARPGRARRRRGL